MLKAFQPVTVNQRKIYPFKSKEDLIDYIQDFKGILIAIGAEKLLSDDTKLIQLLNANIAYCDGFGAVYALKRKGVEAAKIPGAYLWLDIINSFYKDRSFYLLGSTSEILKLTIEKLSTNFPNIKIIGSNNGYFKDENSIIQDIKLKRPEVVFVAMGSPKQEYFMAKCLSEHKALYMGLGGSFDLYTGKAKPVPQWWNKIFKWEGLYRLFTDLKNIKRIKRQKIIFKYISYLIKGKI